MTHQTEVLAYLKKHPKGLTQRMAAQRFNDWRLADTVFKLRGKGHSIGTHLIKSRNSRAYFARYFYFA